jgi:hypothetical protein
MENHLIIINQRLNCSLLYDYEKAQSNIIHVKNGKAEKSYKLDYPKNSAVFDF